MTVRNRLTRALLLTVVGASLPACSLLPGRGTGQGAGFYSLAGTLAGVAVPKADAPSYGPRPVGGYPVATPTERRGFVVSPYDPYHEIDTRGIRRGDLVRDPSCGHLFVQPESREFLSWFKR